MQIIERLKQVYYGWKLSRQHKQYLNRSIEDHMLNHLTDPTLLERMGKDE